MQTIYNTTTVKFPKLNILFLIVFCVTLVTVIALLRDDGNVLDIFKEIMIAIVSWILWYTMPKQWNGGGEETETKTCEKCWWVKNEI